MSAAMEWASSPIDLVPIDATPPLGVEKIGGGLALMVSGILMMVWTCSRHRQGSGRAQHELVKTWDDDDEARSRQEVLSSAVLPTPIGGKRERRNPALGEPLGMVVDTTHEYNI